jgi:hypothetical protein
MLQKGLRGVPFYRTCSCDGSGHSANLLLASRLPELSMILPCWLHQTVYALYVAWPCLLTMNKEKSLLLERCDFLLGRNEPLSRWVRVGHVNSRL